MIKICGLNEPETLRIAVEAGADWIGFNFHPRSPRRVTPAQSAALAVTVHGRAHCVALVVDVDDHAIADIAAALKPDLWQLHGQEPPDRCAAIRAATGTPVMKVVGVSARSDLAAIKAYASADHILLDAKPPKDAAYPGGHGQPFDWRILAQLQPSQPFLLAGGLTPENVAEAIRTVRDMGLNLAGVDVASGVESAPGVKDAQKIRSFVANARRAFDE